MLGCFAEDIDGMDSEEFTNWRALNTFWPISDDRFTWYFAKLFTLLKAHSMVRPEVPEDIEDNFMIFDPEERPKWAESRRRAFYAKKQQIEIAKAAEANQRRAAAEARDEAIRQMEAEALKNQERHE